MKVFSFIGKLLPRSSGAHSRATPASSNTGHTATDKYSLVPNARKMLPTAGAASNFNIASAAALRVVDFVSWHRHKHDLTSPYTLSLASSHLYHLGPTLARRPHGVTEVMRPSLRTADLRIALIDRSWISQHRRHAWVQLGNVFAIDVQIETLTQRAAAIGSPVSSEDIAPLVAQLDALKPQSNLRASVVEVCARLNRSYRPHHASRSYWQERYIKAARKHGLNKLNTPQQLSFALAVMDQVSEATMTATSLQLVTDAIAHYPRGNTGLQHTLHVLDRAYELYLYVGRGLTNRTLDWSDTLQAAQNDYATELISPRIYLHAHLSLVVDELATTNCACTTALEAALSSCYQLVIAHPELAPYRCVINCLYALGPARETPHAQQTWEETLEQFQALKKPQDIEYVLETLEILRTKNTARHPAINMAAQIGSVETAFHGLLTDHAALQGMSFSTEG